MIDHEDEVFQTVSTTLRNKYDEIYILGYGRDLSGEEPRFPTVVITQTTNIPISKYSTFDKLENVNDENYKFEIVSLTGRQCKEIAKLINGIMDSLGYIRTFNEPIPMTDITVARRVTRYRKQNSI